MSRKSVFFILFCLLFVSCSNSPKISVIFNGTAYPVKSVSQKELGANTLAWHFPQELTALLSTSETGPQLHSCFTDLAVTDIESVAVAFLYEGNKTSPGASITGIPATENLSLGLGCSSQVPQGIIIQYVPGPGSNPQITVKNLRFEPLTLGWSRYPAITVGFPSTGGTVSYMDQCPASFDFSDALESVSADSSAQPVIVCSFERQPILNGKQKTVEFAAGTEKITVMQSPAQNTIHLYPLLFRNQGSRFSVTDNKSLVSSVFWTYTIDADRKPITADPGVILTWPRASWKNPDYQLYQWEQFPQVLVFDFADYDIQDQMLKRLAFFTEKAGFKGRLAPDDEIRDLHGYNAHDYRSVSLAAFFNTAARENFPLNQKELELLDILLQNGILLKASSAVGTGSDTAGSQNSNDPYIPGAGAIVSISQESAGSLRWQLLTHECYHGIFFVDQAFQNHVASVYNTMDQRTLEFLLLYFKTQSSLGYDTEDLFLMHTELMSYLLQQGRSSTASYYITRSNYKSMFTADKELCDYIKKTNAQGFVDAHGRLEDYVFTNYGLKGGRVNLIER